jgi:hypothetical protein
MKNNTATYLLFLINPFMALFVVLKDFKTKNIAFFFPIFLAFVGASLYPVGDAERYRDRFYEMHDKELSFENFRSSLLDGETSFDVAIPLISYSIATVTRNEKILFAVFGLILGFFYGKNMQYILDKLDKKNINYYILLLVVVFSMIVTFWDGIRGVRMWTAAHIYFYGASRIIEKQNLKYIGFLVLAFAYHFSFLLPVLVFLGYFFLPKRQFLPVAFVFFVLSLVVADSNVDFIKNLVLNNVPEFFQSHAEGYTGEEYMEKVSNQSSSYAFHHAISGSLIKLSITYLLVLAYLGNLSQLILDNVYTKYFLFVFLIFGFANFISVLPSGGRFVSVALLFAIIPIYYGYQQTMKKYLYHLTIIPLLFWLIFTLRTGFYSLSIGSVIGNPLIIFFDFATEQNLDSLIK